MYIATRVHEALENRETCLGIASFGLNTDREWLSAFNLPGSEDEDVLGG